MVRVSLSIPSVVSRPPGGPDDEGHALEEALSVTFQTARLILAAPPLVEERADGLRALHGLSPSLGALIAEGQPALSSEQIARVYAPRATGVSASEVFGARLPPTFRRELVRAAWAADRR